MRRVLNAPLKVLVRPWLLTDQGHGDVMHHLMTLYFAAGYWASGKAVGDTAPLASAWAWIRKRLLPGPEGTLGIDWTEEPVPAAPQGCNARDTNAYFLVLGVLPRLSAVGVIDREASRRIADALVAHVRDNLVAEPGRCPCIAPSEGPREVVRNILPMFEQSVAWKGHLLVETMLQRAAVRRWGD